MYLHDVGATVDSFTKEDMAQGKHLLSNKSGLPSGLPPGVAPGAVGKAGAHGGPRKQGNMVICFFFSSGKPFCAFFGANFFRAKFFLISKIIFSIPFSIFFLIPGFLF
jgi:hypothetical protein